MLQFEHNLIREKVEVCNLVLPVITDGEFLSGEPRKPRLYGKEEQILEVVFGFEAYF